MVFFISTVKKSESLEGHREGLGPSHGHRHGSFHVLSRAWMLESDGRWRWGAVTWLPWSSSCAEKPRTQNFFMRVPL